MNGRKHRVIVDAVSFAIEIKSTLILETEVSFRAERFFIQTSDDAGRRERERERERENSVDRPMGARR